MLPPPHSLVRRPLGLRPAPDQGVEAAIWAPQASLVRVVDLERNVVHDLEPSGPDEVVPLWLGHLPELGHGDRYLVEVDGERFADPWSRWQPSGVDGPAAVVVPEVVGATMPGSGARPPRPLHEPGRIVLYELHVGAFTRGGDLDDVAARLPHLVDLGVTHLELLPVAQFPGDRGWGYDGIFWSAVQHTYGGPAALVRLVDAAHALGLGVVLDVVFNHVGPTAERSYGHVGPFFTDRHHTPWGPAINVDGPGADVVRETIFQAATWWVHDVGVDGLRVDACHAIADQSARHVLAELAERVREGHPDAVLVAESGLNDPKVTRPERSGGWGFDLDWADDLHHALRAAVTDDREAWLVDFGEVAQVAKALHRPLVHDGTWSGYRGRRFGAPADAVPAHRFVVFSQNHDQVGNRPLGDRPPAELRPLLAMATLLSPFTPMVFMGEELGEDAPFCFFTDHPDPFIADATREGRRREFAGFTAATGEEVPDPQAVGTFERSWLGWEADEDLLDLYRAAIARRASLPSEEPEVRFDEVDRWVAVDRGATTLALNLGRSPVRVPCRQGAVALATHEGWRWTATEEGETALELPPLAGALVDVAARPLDLGSVAR